MKNKFLSLTVLVAMLTGAVAFASPVTKTPFEKVIYLSANASTTTESSANAGVDYTNPKGFFDGDLWVIPAGAIIEDVFVIVDTQVSGLSAFKIGDDDSSTGFITESALTTGLDNYALGRKGSYFQVTSGDISSKVKGAKYYASAGKELKLDVTGTASAGKMRVVIRGYMIGP